MIGFNNGLWQELEQIGIPVTSISVNRGYGAFEFFEIVRGRAFYGERHLARFRRSMDLLHLNTDFNLKLEELVDEIIQRNQLNDAYLKLFALPHETKFEGVRRSSLYMFPTQMPLFDAKLFIEGAWLETKVFQRFMPEAKSTNYLAGQYWMDEQSNPRVVDVLYHNGHSVQETSRGNIFVVKDGTVITPADKVLKGVTRSLVLELLAKHGILHAEAELSLALLHSADEVFVSSTTKHILPIVQIDGRQVGLGKPGLVTLEMMEAFRLLKENF